MTVHGAFAQSVEARRLLNQLGYGSDGSELVLTLVYNPVGTSPPPDQGKLGAAYRQVLEARHGIRFNRLFTGSGCQGAIA